MPFSFKLDFSSKTPLHTQLSDILRTQIQEHIWQPGHILPTELQLQQEYGVSRSVARQAMHTLTSEGLVVRGRGKGSIVAPAKRYHRLAHRVAGLSRQVESIGIETTTQILDLQLVEDAEHAPLFCDHQVCLINRVRYINGIPAAYIRTWLPAAFFKSLSVEILTDASLHHAIEQQIGTQLVSGSRQIQAVSATEPFTQLLQIEKGAPLLQLEGQTTASNGQLIEVFSTWHRGDLITLDIEVSSPSAGPYQTLEPALSASAVSEKPLQPTQKTRLISLTQQLLQELQS